jgi:regulator of replication initiation timing
LTDPQETEPKNLIAKLSVDELQTKNADLEATITKMTDENKTLKTELGEANAILTAQVKKSLVGKLEQLTDIPVVDLQKMGVDELETLFNTAKHLNRGVAKSIRSYGQDTAPESKLNGNPYDKLWGKKP